MRTPDLNEFLLQTKTYAKQCVSNVCTLAKWVVMGVITGSVVGVIGSIFAHTLSFANDLRNTYSWIMFLLPIAGLLVVFLYHFFKNTDDTGTNMVIASIHSSTDISYKMAPLIFVTTVLTHLCGGSSGREGAAIQLGGSITNSLSKIKCLKFNKDDQHINIMCGMSAGFSALFGTPMAAAIFSLEVISVGIMHYSALVPCIIASFTAYFISTGIFHIHPEAFSVLEIPAVSPILMLKILVFGALLGAVSVIFCLFLHTAEKLYKTYFKNPYIRIFVSGCLIILLSLLLQTNMYLGSGIQIIEHIFEGGSTAFYVFILKMLFTALTLGAGFKGGEIVPSFCIGAAFGAMIAPLFGLPTTLMAACGMVGVFCGVTNSPITSLLIAFEMFGFEGMPYYLVTTAVSYMLSGYFGLYKSQKIMYSKTKTQFINSKAH